MDFPTFDELVVEMMNTQMAFYFVRDEIVPMLPDHDSVFFYHPGREVLDVYDDLAQDAEAEVNEALDEERLDMLMKEVEWNAAERNAAGKRCDGGCGCAFCPCATRK